MPFNNKEYQKKYYQENKEKAKERSKARKKTPEYKAYQKGYDARPERKAKRDVYRFRPENIEKKKEYDSIPENIAKARAREKVNVLRPERKEKKSAYGKEYGSRPETKAKERERNFVLKLEVFTHYSKKQTNADFPVCACCLYDDIRALALDHIIPISKSSASEKLLPRGGTELWKYVKSKKYPKGYQVLCYNCNHMKATKVDCPHRSDKVGTYCKIVEWKK